MTIVKCKCGNPDRIQMRKKEGLVVFGTDKSIQFRCWRCKRSLILTFKII